MEGVTQITLGGCLYVQGRGYALGEAEQGWRLSASVEQWPDWRDVANHTRLEAMRTGQGQVNAASRWLGNVKLRRSAQ